MVKHLREADFFDINENVYAFFTCANNTASTHSHEFWELAYVYEGEGINTCNDITTTLRAGDFMLIKPGTAHSIITPKHTGNSLARICNCLIRRSYFDNLINRFHSRKYMNGYILSELLSQSNPLCVILHDDNAFNIKHLMWLIAHEYNHFTAGSSTLIENSLDSLLICITRLYEYSYGSLSTPVSQHEVIDELIKYMTANFSNDLSLDFLAQHVHLSREYLSRYFKKQTGKNISEFLTEIRISRAKEMLSTNTFTVEYISEYCGYGCLRTFEKAFKKVTGITASDYRKQKIAGE